MGSAHRGIALLLAGWMTVLAQLRLEDRARAAGFGFVLQNEASPERRLIETMVGGVAVFDYNGDSRPDIYFVNGADTTSLEKKGERHANRLYRNNGDGTFTDVTAEAGVGGAGFGISASTADYDNDGDVDLFVAGVYRNQLFRNRGDGRFEEVTEAAGLAIKAPIWSVAAGWLDFDRDGWLDLFVVNYLVWSPAGEPFCGDRAKGLRTYCHPRYYEPLPNSLYRNRGDGTFADVSREVGLTAHPGKGMSIGLGDADSDGDIDVFVANDTLPNFLFLNEDGKKFREAGLEAGVAFNDDGRALSSMGTDFRDLDNDGRDDIVFTALANETFPLFRNLGKGLFRDWTHRTGVGRLSLDRSGWGVGAWDFDNNGWKDIFTANGDVQDNAEMYSSRKSLQPNSLWLGLGAGQYRDVSLESGLTRRAQHRGAAFGDFDLDGRIDVAVSVIREPCSVLWNVSTTGNHWLAVRLQGTKSNRQGLGALVKLVSASGLEQYNRVGTAAGYASSSDAVAHFGLGAETGVKLLEVRWPSGVIQQVTVEGVDRYLNVVEP